MFARNEEWAGLRRPSLLHELGNRLDRLQDALGDREWLADAFSIADIAMVTVLRSADDSGLLEERPALSAYVSRGMERPGFKTAMEAQLAAFSAHTPPAKQEA